jgi:hypothetical protein
MMNRNPFSMKKIVFCILLLATVRLAAQGSLSGIVISPYGDAEHGVSVELFTNNGDRFDDKIDTVVAQTLTDKTGYYLIEGIAPGTYAARFNSNQGDSNCITMTMIGVKIADGDKSLDVRLEQRCTAFGAPYACVIKREPFTPKITVQLETNPKSKVMTKVEFEIISTGEKSFRYAYGNPVVTQYFPAGTGRVKVRVYEHLDEDLWHLVKFYVTKPRIKRERSNE